MTQQQIIQAFVQLGKLFHNLAIERYEPACGLTSDEFQDLQVLIQKEQTRNPWFTPANIRSQLLSLSGMLKLASLEDFTSRYAFSASPKKVAIIMAGNIPMVGFHDLLCVVLSGHTAECKLSSSDKFLLPAMTQALFEWQPELKERIKFALGPISKPDAVIATGSDNSAGYFEQYFGKYPHIFRRNRTSVAVLNGTETMEQLKDLGRDIFSYFGLGCRNVSHLLIPEDFDLNRFFEAIVGEADIVNHHKYANNYEYNRTIFLMNKIEFLDNNFVLLKEDPSLFSPLSVIHYQRYSDQSEVDDFLSVHRNSLQVVAGNGFTPFGAAQFPKLDDFADKVDTMKFLEALE